MSIKEIAERAAGEVCGNHADRKYDGECSVCTIGAEAIERAIREAAVPLEKQLQELATTAREDSEGAGVNWHAYAVETESLLAEWRKG